LYRTTNNSRAFSNLAVLGLAFTFAACMAKAEEITLLDGKKVAGTIVGFENGMFKVETEFGFALIRRDKVKNITFAPGAKIQADAPRVETAPPQQPRNLPALVAPAEVLNAPAASETRSSPLPPSPPPISRPLDQPLPPNINARVEGTTYINETFAFSFYKPPGWKIHEDAPRETGRAIVAIGPEDEHTILFVERQAWSGDPNLKSDATDVNLRATYQNYRKVSEASVEIHGFPAIRREFEGELDGALWRGVALRIAKDKTVFGVVGLTSAETLQFHEAVLNKILNSFRFISPSDATVSKTTNP
jgi:hypothetical protein